MAGDGRGEGDGRDEGDGGRWFVEGLESLTPEEPRFALQASQIGGSRSW